MTGSARQPGRRAAAWAALCAVTLSAGLLATGEGRAGAARAGAAAHASSGPTVDAVGAENEYANVISQIGGPYVHVSAVMSNPNTDPHSFEASPSVAHAVSTARLVVQNGAGYDGFMTTIEHALPSSGRAVIVVQKLLGLSSRPPNPHLWYKPTTMPKVAGAVAGALSRLEPSRRAYFTARLRAFDAALKPLDGEIAALRRRFAGSPVATTEPVADYLLQAAGLVDKTPWSLQVDVMNGVDLAPQDVSTEEALLSAHRVKVFVYNRQVTDTVTAHFLSIARSAHIPVVGVYETMPVPGYDYQTWMEAEVTALRQALAHGTSDEKL